MDKEKVLLQCAPGDFDFYHLGNVVASKLPLSDIHEKMTRGIRFYLYSNDLNFGAFLSVLFDQDLNLSMLKEIGNIVTSKVACQIVKLTGAFSIEISPPLDLSPRTVSNLVTSSEGIKSWVGQNYSYFDGSEQMHFHVIIFDEKEAPPWFEPYSM